MRRARFVVVSALLCFGFWQLGQGAYIPAKAWFAQELMQRAWLRASAGEDRAAPWPWADTWPVARLTATSHDVDLIVLAGGSGRTLAFGPGHLGASALPGEIGNMVIAGHRDTHFAFLQEVRRGDRLGIPGVDLKMLGSEPVDDVDRLLDRTSGGAPAHDQKLAVIEKIRTAGVLDDRLIE